MTIFNAKIFAVKIYAVRFLFFRDLAACSTFSQYDNLRPREESFMKYLVGNWKSNKTGGEVEGWFGELEGVSQTSSVEVVVCPSFVHLEKAAGLVSRISGWKLGAQDVSRFPMGKYTGAVSADMLTPFCEYVIVGHSERRKYFGESSQDVAMKVGLALDAGLKPIVCVDEPYASEQINALDESAFEKTIIAYEPLSAIGTGDPDTPEHANEVASKIKEMVDSKSPVLYGGSVTADNVTGFMKVDGIDGFLVGGVSLDAKSWVELIEVVVNLS